MPPSKREELVDAAMKVFYRNGFHNSGLDLIQSESGISRMTLYNHFKSKDELIVAALRRRDELFRNQLMKFVDSHAQDPVDRLLAVFDYHEQWFLEEHFSGCMFINASAEFNDPDCPARRVAADHKIEIIRYLRTLCEHAQLRNPTELSEQLNLLIEGSIVNAHVVGRACNNASTPEQTVKRAKAMGAQLIKASSGS